MSRARIAFQPGCVVMHRLLAAALLLIMFSAPSPASERDWVDCNAENAEQSIAGCTRIIMDRKEASNIIAIAYNNRGVAFKSKSDNFHAFADYTEALRLNPSYARAFYNRGLAYVDIGAPALALADYDAAVQIEPNYTKALASRGILLAEHDAIDESLDDFDNVFKLEKKIDLPLNTQQDLAKKIILGARLDSKSTQPDREMLLLRVVTALGLEDSELLYDRAVKQMDLGGYNQAIVDLNESIKHSATNGQYYAVRCLVYINIGNLQHAASDCDSALHFSPANGFTYAIRGMLNLNRARLPEAEQDLNQAIQLSPGSGAKQFSPWLEASYVKRAQVYEKLGQRNKAIADYKTAAAIVPPPGAESDAEAHQAALNALKRLSPGPGKEADQPAQPIPPNKEPKEVVQTKSEVANARDDIVGTAITSFTTSDNRDIWGQDIIQADGTIGFASPDINACASQCLSMTSCVAVSFDRWYSKCYPKSDAAISIMDVQSTIAIKKPLPLPRLSTLQQTMQVVRNVRLGSDAIASKRVASFDACRDTCASELRCIAFTFLKSVKTANCELFALTHAPEKDASSDSGYKYQAQQ
jgi:tetratricopeptide (TPR) repeat protein